MTTMLTKNFQTLQSEVAKHVAADQVIQGTYWDDKKQKGCFTRCLTYSNDASLLETKYGIPLMLTRIADNICEGLPSGKAVKFLKKFPKAVACNDKDLSLVGWKFLKFELEDLPHKTKKIQDVIEGISKLVRGEEWGRVEARTASAAWGAADFVHAAWAAPDFVRDAANAANAERAASYAAAKAAWAAGAGHPKHRKQQAKTLLRLIKEAPVITEGNS